MLNRTYAGQILPALAEKEVLVAGWVHEVRDIGRVKFVILRDASGLAQLVVKEGSPAFEVVPKLTIESVVSAKGLVKANAEAKSGAEIVVSEISVISKADALPMPVVPKGVQTELPTRFDFRSVDLRAPEHHAVFEVQSALVEGLQSHLLKNGFAQVFTPCIMGVPSESGSEVFQIDYFGKPAFLRQDPQLHRQLTIAGGVEKLFDIGPSWRAEKSHTTKHLCEHRTCAVELAFIEDEHDVMRVEEAMVVAAIKNVKKKCKSALKLLGAKIKTPKTPFPELSFPDVYNILREHGLQVSDGDDVAPEAEKVLADYVKKKFKSEFFFVNRYPFKLKPFYVMKVDSEPLYARSTDMYFRNLELSSGGQREHRYENLMSNLAEKNMSPASVEWFTKFFKWGVPPHGGFALGIERLTKELLGLENVREAVLFPRDPERIVP